MTAAAGVVAAVRTAAGPHQLSHIQAVPPFQAFLSRLPYLVAVVLLGIGLVVLIDDENLVKKVVGLNLFQTGIFLFLVTAAVRDGGRSPNLAAPGPYVDPVPQVLVLTAIVVGVAVTAVALALVVRIYRTYGSLREDVIREAMDR